VSESYELSLLENPDLCAPNAELRISLQQYFRVKVRIIVKTSTVPCAFHGWGHDPDQAIIALDCKLNIIDVYFLRKSHDKHSLMCVILAVA
jgi:hypothetical protein